MNKIIFLFSGIILHTCIFAQEPSNGHYCSTLVSGITPYHLAANAKTGFPKSGTTLYIPVTMNLVGMDNGTGYYSADKVLEALCILNDDFYEHDFVFYLENINYINSSVFYDMTFDYWYSSEMYQFIEDNNTVNTMNVYFIKDANSNFVSYNELTSLDWSTYPPGILFTQNEALVIDLDVQNSTDEVITHETGHFFSLHHPFALSDWSEFSVNGTPDTTYLTVEDPDNDTTYVYPWLVERVNDLNCQNTGDFICDTGPDYLNWYFDCNVDGESEIVQTDPDGNTFRSDGTLYMAYTNCPERFSPQQVDVMRAVAEGPRDYLLYDQTPPGTFSVDDLSLIYPPDGAAVNPVNDSVTLEWNMPGADYYLLSYGVKPLPNLFFPYGSNILVTDTQYQINVTNFDFEYYWIIRGVSKYYPCEVWADTSSFNAVLVGTEEIPQRETLKLYPNPANDLLYMEFQDLTSTPGHLEATILDSQGRLIGRMPVVDKNVNISALPAGIYFLKLADGERVYAGKFVKQ